MNKTLRLNDSIEVDILDDLRKMGLKSIFDYYDMENNDRIQILRNLIIIRKLGRFVRDRELFRRNMSIYRIYKINDKLINDKYFCSEFIDLSSYRVRLIIGEMFRFMCIKNNCVFKNIFLKDEVVNNE